MRKNALVSLWLFGLVIFGGSPTSVRAASDTIPNFHFDCFSAADGLSFSMTMSIFQDRRGFMWFGTRYGINKFDGNNFTVYLPGSSSDVMGGNYIYFIYEDRAGNLWMSTSIDLVRWERKSGKFIHYKNEPDNPNSLTPGRINTILEDAGGKIWIATNSGLNRYEPATETFTRYFQDQMVFRIYNDRRGGIWLGMVGELRHYSTGSMEQQNPVVYQKDPADPASYFNYAIAVIHEDREGVVWVGAYGGGLDRLDRASGQFFHYSHDPDDPYSLSEDRVTSILEDGNGRLWIATEDGLNLFDRSTGRFYQYHLDSNDPYSLRSDAINDLYEDRSGVVWIASLAGICKINETASRFTIYQQGVNQAEQQAESQPGSLPRLSDNLIISVYQDRQGILWVGTSQFGLNRIDRSTGRVTVYQHDPANPTSLNYGEVSAIFEDKAGTLWIGTTGGLDRFNPQNETFESVEGFEESYVGAITEDQQGNLWVGKWTGLARREAGASTFVDFPLTRDTSTGERVQRLVVDQTGTLWIATQNKGLFRVDPSEGDESTPAITHFSQDANDPKSPGATPVMGFFEDTNGTLWMGTVNDGLVRFNRDTLTFTHFMPETGLGKYISCVQGDARGMLWMGTVLGLARFDPLSEKFAYFDARDGLKFAEGIPCFQSKEGEMFFGSLAGLITFFPDQIRDNPNPPPVVITALNLKNQAPRTDLPPDEQFMLSYQENYLSFDFTALDYTAPAKNQYAYKMEGLDADWILAGNRRHADYPDLQPGTYTFRVKASNNSGVWNEQGVAVQITIMPPFWQTWWFYGLMSLALVGIVAVGIRLRLRGVEARSRDLEKQVNERTNALEQKTLETELRRQELEALLSADDRMQRYLRQDQVLQALVDVAVDILHADKSAVFWWDEKREKLVTRVGRGFKPQAIRELQFSRTEGIVAGAIQSRTPVLVEDSLTDPRRDQEDPKNVKFSEEENIRSFMFFPITIGDEVLGIFNVSYEKPHAAGEGELRLFQALVQRAALQIENARLYEQSKELAVLEERGRLARELHDAVTQTLFSASLVAEALPSTWEKDPQQGHGLLQELRNLSRGALAEMRTLLLELRPAALVETRLDDLLRQLGEAASGREGIPVNFTQEGQGTLPPEVHIALYRIAQEALNNVVKHARASQVDIRLLYIDVCQEEASQVQHRSVQLSITDNGRGFDMSQVPHHRLGLGIMQERAQSIGAHLFIDSHPGEGTQVNVVWEQGFTAEGE